jgi:hypothetical protein
MNGQKNKILSTINQVLNLHMAFNRFRNIKPPPRLEMKAIASKMALGAGAASFLKLFLLIVVFELSIYVHEDDRIILTIIWHLQVAPLSYDGRAFSVFCLASAMELSLDAFVGIQRYNMSRDRVP